MRGLANLLPLLLIAGVFWLLVLRPAQARRQQAAQVQAELAPGARIVTTSGLFATVLAVEGDVMLLETAPGVTSRWARGALGRVLDPDDSLHPDDRLDPDDPPPDGG
ncbi:preprotein translocase subunit YajC [Motilibacter peucedani]|uniref:Preprotein translocase subunit YajC n=1 Tax=Motilibacter peucedani TaxID=598650 RepID=A0A420XSC6_9ACTN|nr:preprotein translocase subunit YajC [Motilibacter peucedani]RKS77730.1 preprotein translocase subunit YajC [Motilibacter peucedani]